ncbi:MAG: hypothetical protein COT24_02390 [Candidatus Kerfeldbacteria bacterium CG08_land_8_20_14_0_20_40_16]|uniref:Uncharacterized protein n=1 Tax=Candidatus Kerfeldbacteria bacterium CG08_land_8_20_14_0_20_40_16 TaxID=2014244 RepID=A0A2H0YVV0_9BACT|nr:MAG: hypothetical protein COT24_02390 [Candidatus Kerfeldbacteria bacterium CG08_land_8_20_14_0_20_40_16]
MKFLFVQKSSFPAAGPMIISALLKKNGFEVDLLLADEEKNLLKSIQAADPDIVGLPCFTGQHDWVVETCQEIKNNFKGIKTMLGGPHPTYYPEIIKEPGVDMIVRGEAEFAVLELLQKLQNQQAIDQVPNVWLKKENAIVQNEMSNLPEDLDQLPLPDREIYYQYKFLRRVSVKQFLSGRGCPYHCAFCANNILRKIYKDKGQFLRRRSPEGVVQEILEVKQKYGLRTASFTDDVFITDKNWLKEFLPLFKAKVGVPFMCNVTANLVEEETIQLLKENGCYGISMGVESGNQDIRFKVLKKYITDDRILNGGRLAKKYGLILKTYNILCLPEETIEKAIGTMELNAKIESDFAACSLLQPFPEYDITNYAKEHHYLPPDYSIKDVKGGIYRSSPIKLLNKNQFINLQKLFFVGVKLPWFIPLIKKLIKLPPNFVFNLIGRAMYGIFMSKVHRLTLKDMINYALHIDPYDV